MTRRACNIVALALLLLYAVPLFAPPPPLPLAPPRPGAGLWERLFPQVPPWWVCGRLAALAVGAVGIAWSLRSSLPLRRSAAAARSSAGDWRGVAWGALLISCAQAVSAMFAARFSLAVEVAYFFLLPLPAVLLALGEARAWIWPRRAVMLRALGLLIVPALWALLVGTAAWRSPRAANLVDMWIMIDRLGRVVSGEQKLLTDSADPGHTNAYMMLQGTPLVACGWVPLSFAWLQLVHLLWTAVCGLATGGVAWRTIGYGGAIVAQAVLLFSPYGISTAYNPGMNQIAPLCTAVMLLLLVAVRDLGSAAALAAFGAVAGFSTTEPTLYATAGWLVVMMVWVVRGMSPIPWPGIGVGVLLFIAAAAPGFPDLGALVSLAERHAFGEGQLASVVRILFGQDSVFLTQSALRTGSPGLLDVPVGAMLAPFATGRMPMRLWGDALIDPVGGVLMAIGLALCVFHVARNQVAFWLVTLFAAGLLHAFTSSGDATSYSRLLSSFVPMALFAAVSFEVLRLRFLPAIGRGTAAAAAAVAVAASGWIVFAVVNPRILPASSLAISFEALGTREPNAEAVFLEPPHVEWLHVRLMAELLPARPQEGIVYDKAERLAEVADVEREVIFWSPGLETDAAVSRSICERWPAAGLYTLGDRTGTTRAHAAAPAGVHWQPRLPADRWSVATCQGRAGR